MTKPRAIGSHHSAAMKSDTWLTPKWLIDALPAFDLDPCAAPEPRPWPTAAEMYGKEADGLSCHWWGNVWLNPPYSREAVKWLEKLADHGTGIALIFARTETAWFVEQVWKRADALLFLHGRVTFCRADGTPAKANSGAPSCLVAYGRENARWLAMRSNKLASQPHAIPGTFVQVPA